MFKKNTSVFLLTLIITIGAFLRFYKLDWGNGLFTHPDEYHIVASVNQLSFPDQMNPHFFSYGTVTIYLIYFTQEFFAFLNSHNSLFIIPNSFLLGRFYSAFFSTLTIFVIYKISKIFLPHSYALLAAFFVAITPGLIQQAHFTTPESNLIFFLFSSLLFTLYFLRHNKNHYILLASVFLGLALGVKISSVVFLLTLETAIIFSFLNKKTEEISIKHICKKMLKTLHISYLSIIIVLATLVIVAPFIFLDFPAFRGNLEYEGNLAAGNIPVFYTRQFIHTIPILFQLEKIFPYAIGLPLLVVGLIGFFVCLFIVIKKPLHKYILSFVILSFLSIFIPNAFLFAKWTRFVSPTFPFFAIFSAFLVSEIAKKQKLASYMLTGILVITTSLWACAFFSIYTHPDIRITASQWLVSNAPPQSTMLIEGGNMIDIPLSGNFNRLGFDFYTFEDDQNTRMQIADGLEKANYFLVQSRRVFLNHQRARKEFPKTAHFYDMLFAGKLGFEEIKEFHQYPTLEIACPPMLNFCRRGKFSIDFTDEQAEETWSVFDHPVIRIFKKTNNLSTGTYEKVFN